MPASSECPYEVPKRKCTVLAAEQTAVLALANAVAVKANAIAVPSRVSGATRSLEARHIIPVVGGRDWRQQRQRQQVHDHAPHHCKKRRPAERRPTLLLCAEPKSSTDTQAGCTGRKLDY